MAVVGEATFTLKARDILNALRANDVGACVRLSPAVRSLSPKRPTAHRSSLPTAAGPFLSPVSSIEYPTYSTIVTRPMDLGTISLKLDGNEYPSPAHFIQLGLEQLLPIQLQSCHCYLGLHATNYLL